MIPIAFNGCFGWFHDGGTSRGVVLCSPVGAEADYVYASWRNFAECLAGAGFSTLRFDYPGLYNSMNIDEGSDPPTAWVESIKAAIAWLKTEAHVETVVLVGLRFGAGLALKCAEELGGLARLVLMAPVVSGVTYQRELALLYRLSEGGAPTGREAPHKGAALFTAERTFGVESLRSCQGPQRPAERVLILSEPASGNGKTLGDKLRALGSEVIHLPFQGYAELMVQPERARYPEDAFGKVLDWLRDETAAAPTAPNSFAPRCPATAVLTPIGVRETPVFFRDTAPLFGIYCQPDPPRETRPCILFLNTAAIPHAGMNGMWVSMARRFAAIGFTSLRFDLSGVGDSPLCAAPTNPEPSMKKAYADVVAAIDWFQARGFSTVTLIGFCWGAQLACNVALGDSRVTRLIMINSRRRFWDMETDKPPPRTFKDYLRLLRDPERWKSLWRGAISKAQIGEMICRMTFLVNKIVYEWAAGVEGEAKKATRKLVSLHERGVDTFFVQGNDDTFLVGIEDYFGVDRHGFARLWNIDTHFFPGVRHLFPNEASLAGLAEVIGRRLLPDRSAIPLVPVLVK